MTTFLPLLLNQENKMELECIANIINIDCFEENETNENLFEDESNVDMTSCECQTNIQQSSPAAQLTKLSDLSLDIIREIFDYLALGDIYYSFYQLTNLLSNFIDNCFTCLDLISMSYRQFRFYYEQIASNNIDHCRKIESIILSDKKPLNQIETLIPILDSYNNLTKLKLYSPNEIQLEILSSFVPNLCELDIIFDGEKSTNNIRNINWLSYLQNLQICSIDSKINGMEIDQSMHSLSHSLTSLSLSLSSASDFYTLLSLLPSNTFRYLNISLFDNEFSYAKTCRTPISYSTKLMHFSFNMSLIPMKDASCLYDIIRFVSNILRQIQILTIICRLADGVVVDENKFRDYLSFIYSVEKYNLYIETNNLSEPTFDASAYTYPFWTEKNAYVNVYRNKHNQIKRVRIYTLPLISNIINLSNYSEDIHKQKLIK